MEYRVFPVSVVLLLASSKDARSMLTLTTSKCTRYRNNFDRADKRHPMDGVISRRIRRYKPGNAVKMRIAVRKGKRSGFFNTEGKPDGPRRRPQTVSTADGRGEIALPAKLCYTVTCKEGHSDGTLSLVRRAIPMAHCHS